MAETTVNSALCILPRTQDRRLWRHLPQLSSTHRPLSFACMFWAHPTQSVNTANAAAAGRLAAVLVIADSHESAG